MRPETTVKVLLICGSVIIILSALFAGFFGMIFNAVVNNILVISEDGAIYDTYVAPDVPIYMDFYFFDVQNPKDVQYYGAKPILVETGPYSYLETYKKRNVSFSDDGEYVSYYQDTAYYFQRNRSIGDLNDTVTIVNPIMVLAGSLLYESGFVTELVWPEIEKGMDLFETHTIGELTFDGWELPYFNFDFSRLPLGLLDKTEGLNGTLYDIIGMVTGRYIPYLAENKIGIYYKTNNTDDGLYKVHTGKNSMDNYLFIEEWDYKNELDYWHNPYCDMINGTDGTQFPPNIDKNAILELFTTDLCRSIYFTYETDTEVRNMLKSYKYIVTQDVLAAPIDNPANQCYCAITLPGDSTEECYEYASMINLAACYSGAPVVLSTPHFYMGDQSDVDNFIGLNPISDVHETYLDVEPKTGVVLDAAKRIQLNVPLKRYGNLPSFRSVPEVIFPMFWGSENYILPEDDAESFNKLLTLPFIIVYSICAILILVGICLIILGLVKRSRNKREPKLSKLEKHKNSIAN